jgi:transposase-like protein
METSMPVRKRFTSEQRDEIVRAYRSSGLPQREFAAQAGIGLSTLAVWLRKIPVSPGGVPEFIRLPNVLTSTTATPVYRLHLAGGVILEIGSGFRSQELASLLQLLGSSCSR